MNRRRTLLVGAVVALVLFALMALTIRSTDPWTVDAATVSDDAQAMSATLGASVNDVEAGKAVNAAVLRAQGDALSSQIGHLLEAMATWSGGAELQTAGARLEANQTSFMARMAAVGDAPTVIQLQNAQGAATRLAGAVTAVETLANGLSAKANDQASVVDTLFGPQVIAFEVLGVLLTAAMIGALVIARPIDAAEDESHYSHPTPAQVAESDNASDPALHTDAARLDAGLPTGVEK